MAHRARQEIHAVTIPGHISPFTSRAELMPYADIEKRRESNRRSQRRRRERLKLLRASSPLVTPLRGTPERPASKGTRSMEGPSRARKTALLGPRIVAALRKRVEILPFHERWIEAAFADRVQIAAL